MSNVISFLERMGQDAGLRGASIAELKQEMIRDSLDEASRAAIIAKDPVKLASLLKIEKNVCCMIYPVEDTQ